jgi:hypothetical protein
MQSATSAMATIGAEAFMYLLHIVPDAETGIQTVDNMSRRVIAITTV